MIFVALSYYSVRSTFNPLGMCNLQIHPTISVLRVREPGKSIQGIREHHE